MSYPYSICIVCHNRVQKVVEPRRSYVPGTVVRRSAVPSSQLFDDRSVFELHCRGQGRMYNHGKGALAFGTEASADDVLHYNFSGFFAGMCCFCARHSGFGTELFVSSGCHHCVRKHILHSAFARLFGKGRHTSDQTVCWASCGWMGLPSSLVDYILAFVVGIHGGQQISVVDGRIRMNLVSAAGAVE